MHIPSSFLNISWKSPIVGPSSLVWATVYVERKLSFGLCTMVTSSSGRSVSIDFVFTIISCPCANSWERHVFCSCSGCKCEIHLRRWVLIQIQLIILHFQVVFLCWSWLDESSIHGNKSNLDVCLYMMKMKPHSANMSPRVWIGCTFLNGTTSL